MDYSTFVFISWDLKAESGVLFGFFHLVLLPPSRSLAKGLREDQVVLQSSVGSRMAGGKQAEKCAEIHNPPLALP